MRTCKQPGRTIDNFWLRSAICGIPKRRTTVADGIRSMSDEELAEEIIRRWRSETEDGALEDISKRWCDMKGCVSSNGYYRPCTDERLFACVLRWLRRPAEEEEHGPTDI